MESISLLVKSLLRQRNCLYHRDQVAKADALSLKIGKIINAVRSDRFSNVDVGDSKELWQMKFGNTNYNSRCTIESLGVNIDEQIDNMNAFFTNVTTDPDYDSDIIKNIFGSHSGIRASQVLDDISEYKISVRLSQLKNTAP